MKSNVETPVFPTSKFDPEDKIIVNPIHISPRVSPELQRQMTEDGWAAREKYFGETRPPK
jgi:hypothetical protein